METTTEKKELLVLTTNPIEVFTGGTVRSVVDSIKEEARSFVPDPSTEKGRKEIASLAAIEAEKAEVAAQAERERLAAEERHRLELQQAKEEAERQERNRLAAIEAERVAEEKRAANAKHRKAILAEIAADLATEAHLVDELAGAVAQVLASGKIRHITITF